MQQKQADKSFRIAELAGKYLRGTITAAELAELKDWANATKGGNQLMQEVTDSEWLQREIETFSQTNTEEGWLRLQDKVLAAQAAKGKKPALIRPFDPCSSRLADHFRIYPEKGNKTCFSQPVRQ
jgi:hypothetical protein